jgi:hypothetical protein
MGEDSIFPSQPSQHPKTTLPERGANKERRQVMGKQGVNWLKECDICNVGLCKRLDELVSPVSAGGQGLSEREAARVMEKEAEEQIGKKVWTAGQIRRRYVYHTGKWESDKKPVKPAGPKRATKKRQVQEPVEQAPEQSVQSRCGQILSSTINLWNTLKDLKEFERDYMNEILAVLGKATATVNEKLGIKVPEPPVGVKPLFPESPGWETIFNDGHLKIAVQITSGTLGGTFSGLVKFENVKLGSEEFGVSDVNFPLVFNEVEKKLKVIERDKKKKVAWQQGFDDARKGQPAAFTGFMIPRVDP